MEHPLNLTSFLPAEFQHHYLHVVMLSVAVLIIFFMGLYVRTLRSEVPGKAQNFFEFIVIKNTYIIFAPLASSFSIT